MEKELLSTKETMSYLNIKSWHTLNKIVEKAKLTKVKVGDLKINYKKSELDNYLNQNVS